MPVYQPPNSGRMLGGKLQRPTAGIQEHTDHTAANFALHGFTTTGPDIHLSGRFERDGCFLPDTQRHKPQ